MANKFDQITAITSKNNDNVVNSNSSASSAKNKKSSNVNKASAVSSKATKPTIRRSKSNKSEDTKWKEEINLLKHQYSTARLNKNDVISLKILQKIAGDNSRSKLIEEMIDYAKPIILNSKAKRKQYKKLYEYAVKGAEINAKFKND